MPKDRKKLYKEYIGFFKRTFNLPSEPFKVLCDGNFVYHFVKNKLGSKVEDLEHLISTVLDYKPIKVYVVESSLREVQILGENDTLNLLKTTEKLRVGKDFEQSYNMEPSLAIRKFIGAINRKGYIVATMDEELKEYLRSVPGVPLLFFSRVMIGLEAPSEKSKQYWKNLEETKMKVPKEERKRLREITESMKSEEEKANPKKKQRKRRKKS